MGHILIADDEPSICELVQLAMESAGHQVTLAANGYIAEQLIHKQRPDLLILDWMMPMLSGIDLTRKLKDDERTSDIPIILLTARAGEQDSVAGLNAGADDYVTKPFSPKELVARVSAVLRRSSIHKGAEEITADKLVLNIQDMSCRIDDKPIPLGPLEFRLLEFFMQNPNRVFSRSQLLDRVWGNSSYVEERTVDVHIRRLRKAISYQDQCSMIQTVRGAGYRLSFDL